MLSYLQQFINNLSKPKNYLLLLNIFLVFFLIIFKNLGVIPPAAGDFIFFALLTLALALYRPGWVFLMLAGMVILENINLAPESFGISVRPYQFAGALIVAAILIRFTAKKLYFKLIKLKWYDYLVLAMSFSGFLSAAFSSEKFASFKLSAIFASFAILYILARNYIQNLDDLKKIIPFFLGSSLVVILYGLWQNIAFLQGKAHFEAMPGRPNATFMEADWLGMFLVLLISVCYLLIYYFQNFSERLLEEFKIQNSKFKITSQKLKLFFLYITLVLSYILLIITVSRSAWLGALAAAFMFLFIALTNLKFNSKNWRWREIFYLKLKIFLPFLVSLAVVYVFHLTNFQLFNRIQSTGSGLQKITVSCWLQKCTLTECIQREMPPIENISSIEELKQYGCKHINLEDIEKEKQAGNIIAEVYRPDPNISLRAQIYQKSWQEIKKHPFLGIGWGNIGPLLGRDGRDNYLNSSNIFLETWLGAGFIGFFSLIIFFAYILLKSVKNYCFSANIETKILNLFIIASWFGLVVSNLFNAGMFLGFLWIWFAIAQIGTEKASPSY